MAMGIGESGDGRGAHQARRRQRARRAGGEVASRGRPRVGGGDAP